MYMYGLPVTLSVHLFISFNICPVNTKLENVANSLFLTIQVLCCLAHDKPTHIQHLSIWNHAMVHQANSWILSQGWFIESFDVLYSEWSQVTDPYLDHSNRTHSEGLDNVWEGAGTQVIKGRLFNTNQQFIMQKILSWHQFRRKKSYWLAIRDFFPLTFIFGVST